LALFVVNVLSSSLLKKVALNFVFLHGNTIFLVILLNKLNKTLELSSAIVTTLTCRQV
jgi:hypothetical protein